MSKKKMTGAEIMKQDAEEAIATVKAWMKDAEPKTPLEAAIDRATGFKPEDAVKAVMETDQAETGTEKPETETKTEKPETETEKPETKTEKPETKTEKPESETKKRDWVGEAVKCFIKDVKDLDPTDPISAIAAYFAKNATAELKARCKSEGKNATGCWRFIEAVARKALGNRPGHIDPCAIYAIAMHYFEDVPKDWDKKDEPKKTAAPKKTASVQQQQAAKPKKKPKKPAETPSEIRKEKERMAKAKAKAKAKKPRVQQGFFFEMLDMHTGQPEKDGLSSPQASAGASGEENAMVPRTLPASTSSTESEVQV